MDSINYNDKMKMLHKCCDIVILNHQINYLIDIYDNIDQTKWSDDEYLRISIFIEKIHKKKNDDKFKKHLDTATTIFETIFEGDKHPEKIMEYIKKRHNIYDKIEPNEFKQYCMILDRIDYGFFEFFE